MTKTNRFKRYKMRHPFEIDKPWAIFDNIQGLWVLKNSEGYLTNYKDSIVIVKKLNSGKLKVNKQGNIIKGKRRVELSSCQH